MTVDQTDALAPGDSVTPPEAGQNVEVAEQSKKNRRRRSKSREKGKAGRPTVVTPDAVAKLIGSFAAGADITAACFIAGISRDAYYTYCKQHPAFADIKDRMKATPGIVALQRIMKEIQEAKSEDALRIAWDVINKFGHPDMPKPEAAALPAAGPTARLTGGAPGQNVQVNVQQIRVDDLTDEECERLARGEPIEKILGDRSLLHKSHE